ncbi:MAG: hypothetical protein M3P49_07990 [Actinomycetota bacterium]|nr:hypothetical protein [Actinomycetota bacterium]
MGLMRQLDRARYVRFDEGREAVLAWFGGHGCHAYDRDGLEFAYWNLGTFADDSANFEEVAENFEQHIITGDYTELF